MFGERITAHVNPWDTEILGHAHPDFLYNTISSAVFSAKFEPVAIFRNTMASQEHFKIPPISPLSTTANKTADTKIRPRKAAYDCGKAQHKNPVQKLSAEDSQFAQAVISADSDKKSRPLLLNISSVKHFSGIVKYITG
jgi:hypothetical protein